MNSRSASTSVPGLRVLRRWPAASRRLGVLALAVALVVTLHDNPAVARPVTKGKPPTPQVIPSVATHPVAAQQQTRVSIPDATHRPAPVWPSPDTAEVALPSVPQSRLLAGDSAASGRAGDLPVWVGRGAGGSAPGRVRVQLLDRAHTHAAAVSGVLLRVTRADGISSPGPVQLTVDYRGFADAYGGNWASRLRFKMLPECALTTPGRSDCTGQVLRTANTGAGTAVATTPIGSSTLGTSPSTSGTLVALDAGSSGNGGDYRATSLQPSSTWSAGGNSGDFTWSYPMRVPPAVGGPAPQLALSYSAQSVDGRQPAANNQPSQVGAGFDLAAGGFIERRYKACNDDKTGGNNSTDVGDQCWAADNAILSMAGHSGELIFNASEGRWHLRSDDGSRIQRLTGAVNGDNDGEYWVVTTTDGTQYWFGLGRLQGWAATNPETNSTWTMPVFGNQTGEPCHQTTFANSSCTQAWRWNLDYVVDTHANTMSLWYGVDTNKYARNLAVTAPVDYIRAGWLDHIDYGTDQRSLDVNHDPVDSVFAGSALAKVVFGYADRCISACTIHDGTHFPDTPWDQQCTGAPCNVISPTFWTTRGLSTVTTRVWDAAATPAAHRDVEKWTLAHTFPDPGDTNKAGLWLDRISHAGLAGGQNTTVPDVQFTPVALNNRVDGIDFATSMNWMRITKIRTETGATIDVTYAADCVATDPKPVPESNVKRCYPVKWKPEGYTSSVTDWFHKYVVATIYHADNTGGVPPYGSPRIAYSYSYLSAPAWHYTDDDGIIGADYKTWSVWRGYAKVGVTVGDPGEATYTETRYFRGMHGDKQPQPTGTRTVIIDGFNDEDWWAGATREQITFNGPGGAEVSATVNDPWASAATATRTTTAGDTVTARFTDTAVVTTRTALDGGRPPRQTRTTTTFDSYGMPVQVDDEGDLAIADDQKCAKTVLEPRNTTKWLLEFPHRQQSFAVACSQTSDPTVLTDADIIADTRTSYDGQAWGTAPIRGSPTLTERANTWNAGAPTFITTAGVAYDAPGRVIDTWDALTRHTLTSYTPSAGGPLTGVKVKNPLSHVATSYLDPAWGTALATVDANDKRTDLSFDGLGRVTAVWLPGRVKGTDTPHATFAYLVRTDAPSVVTTNRIHPTGFGYVSSDALYDGMLRARQTQTPSPTLVNDNNSRIVTDTFYDAVGRVSKTHGAYNDLGGSPGTTLLAPNDPTAVATQTRTVYDGAGRVTDVIFQPHAVERWRTTTAYGGDRTDVTPPSGGTATSTVVNARGLTTELRQYQAATPTGAYDATTYTYTRKSELAKVTDPAGNHWGYGYDLLGRQTSSIDPDKGSTTNVYDNAGQLSSTTDARGYKLVYAYDQLGRRNGLIYGTARANWIYDTVAKGYLSESKRNTTTGMYRYVINSYNDAYQPTDTSFIIPFGETGLGGTYTYGNSYNADGSPNTVGIPATGDLRDEQLAYEYHPTLPLPNHLTTNFGPAPNYSYVSGTDYNALAQVNQVSLYTGAGSTYWLSYNREPETSRLTNLKTTQKPTTTLASLDYTYDNAGNITKIADTVSGDNQCFRQDYVRRLTDAWTPTSGDCAIDPTVAGLGGPAPYWQTWSYDKTGNRLSQVEHATPAGDATTTYAVPSAGSTKPHTLTSWSRTDTAGTTSGSYTYDNAGNTKTRPTTAGTQTLTWDPEGHLSTSTDSTGTTTYIYDADGNRLIKRDPTGRTLYLPGQELRYTTATNTTTCTRYYAYNGTTVASRTNAGLTWLAGDHQGTAQTAIDAITQQATTRRQTPFGAPRGTNPTWPNNQGFVGGTRDNTQLTHLGAREYDPGIGRFISLDPIVDSTDPQTLHGYAYTNNTPITASDPTGLAPNICLDECGSKDDKAFQASVRTQRVKQITQERRRKRDECRRMGECGNTYDYDHVGQPGKANGPGAGMTKVLAYVPCTSWESDISRASCGGGMAGTGVGYITAQTASRADASERFRYGGTREIRSAASREMAFMARHPWISRVGEWGKNPWVRGTGRALVIGGFGLSAAGYFTEGDDGATALTKAGVETGVSVAFAVGGSALGLLCLSAAVVCSPVLGAAGGVVGGAVGGWINDKLDSGVNVLRLDFKPYKTIDSWFNWD